MIKQLGAFDIIVSPLIAETPQRLYNTINDGLVLLEPLTGSAPLPDTFVSLDYIDYVVNSQVNSDCNIALEQQEESTVIYEEGIYNDGTFDPQSDARNLNNTYKKLVYSQIKSTFYNTYNNPFQIFGLEHIDFYLGRTERYISDQFRVFTIPQNMFGDRMVKQTVSLVDNTMDDNVSIVDDGYCNLIASKNLFSKIQEVRNLGNLIFSGSVSCG
jgi:hypothetical protein